MVQFKTLTKLAISDSIAERCGLKKNQASQIVNSLFAEISGSLENFLDVKLSKFGNLKIKHKKERSGRNPKTLEETIISERSVVVFKSNKTLNRIINKNIAIYE